MDLDFFMWAVGVILTVGIPSIGWVVNMIFNKLKELDHDQKLTVRRLSEHKLHAAETFATKHEVNAGFDRVMNKLESMDDKLDRKQDK